MTVGGILRPDAINGNGNFELNGGTLVLGRLNGGGTGTVRQAGGAANIGSITTFNTSYEFNGGSFSAGSIRIQGGRYFRMGPTNDLLARFNAIELLTADGGIGIGRGAIVVDYTGASPLATIRGYVITGNTAAGTFTGGGIASVFANATTHGVGYAEASDLGGSVPPVFGNVDADAVLIRFTRRGDANLDGAVNLQDFNRLAGAFGTTGGALWSHGDFNHDGNANLDDFNLLASNFGLSAAGPTVTPQDWSALAAAVPEPQALGLACAAITALARRRRRA